MTDKQMKRLSRAELLELLLRRSRECEQLSREAEELRLQLEQKPLSVVDTQSVENDAQKVNAAFEDAIRISGEYLQELRLRVDEQKNMCDALIRQAQIQAEKIVADAQAAAQQLEEDTQRRCDELYLKAQQEADRKWDELFAQLGEIKSGNAQMQQRLEADGKKRKRGI